MRCIKNLIGICLMGLGLGILLVVFLPIKGWLFLIGISIIVLGGIWLKC